MEKTDQRLPTFVKYLLLEAPGWLLAGLVALLLYEHGGLSASVIVTLLAAWVGKDLVLYPFLKDALSGDAGSEADKLVGRTGVAETTLDPVGIVRLGAELWRAESRDRQTPIPGGTRVRVTTLRGLTLLVIEAEVETDRPAGACPAPGEALHSRVLRGLPPG